MPQTQRLILLADDDKEDIELLEEAILQLQPAIQIKSVSNGNKVLEFLDTTGQLPCMIILDYNMPEMNGAEVLQKLCADPRFEKLPKIIWSTSNNNAFVRKSMENGAAAYLIKPSTHDQLQQQAKQILDMCLPV